MDFSLKALCKATVNICGVKVTGYSHFNRTQATKNAVRKYEKLYGKAEADHGN